MWTILLGAVGFVAMLTFSAFYMYTGGAGIYAWGGGWWLAGAVLAFLSMRITFPFTLGAFYFSWQVWGWHWSLALVYALPGLAVALPTMLVGVLSWAKDTFGDLFKTRKQREAEERDRAALLQLVFDEQERIDAVRRDS